jgi:hypothetical protein
MTSRVTTFVLAVSILAAGAARADQVILGAAHDNTLYNDPAGAVSNGSGPTMFTGTTAAFGSGARRALVAFDIAAALPAGSTVISTRLILNMSQTISGDQTVTIHRVLNSWGEGVSDAGPLGGQGAASEPGDATWVHRFFNSVGWSTAGGDFVGGASASTAVGGFGSYAWGSTPAMVADVQGWLDAPVNNHGWIVIGNEGAMATAKRFDTRENPIASVRPQLVIEYTPPSVPVEGVTWSKVKGIPESQ